MAFTFTTNQTPATGAIAMYLFMVRLVAAGWVVKSSSDGTTYNSTGNQISSGASGAGGLANNNAWFRIQDPGGVREYTFQRGTTNTQWRVKYSASAKFTTGSPGATQTPQSTDQQLVRGLGGGTDASPTFGTFFGSDNGYRFHCGADNASGYGAYLVTYPIGGWSSGSGLTVLVLEPLIGTSSGDVDAWAHYVGLNAESSVCGATHLSNNTSGPQGYLAKGLAGEGFVVISALTYKAPAGDFAPAGSVSNPHNSKDDDFPIPLARRLDQSLPSGWKGLTTVMKWRAVTRATASTITTSSTKDGLVINQIKFPWDGSTDPIL